MTSQPGRNHNLKRVYYKNLSENPTKIFHEHPLRRPTIREKKKQIEPLHDVFVWQSGQRTIKNKIQKVWIQCWMRSVQLLSWILTSLSYAFHFFSHESIKREGKLVIYYPQHKSICKHDISKFPPPSVMALYALLQSLLSFPLFFMDYLFHWLKFDLWKINAVK